MSHPYTDQAPAAFWRKFVSDTPWRGLDFVGTPKFRIAPEQRVATAGSCFAQHITRHMRKRGFTPFQAEQPHPLMLADGMDTSSYQTFSARYGNVYTSRQMLELIEQACGARPQIDDHVREESRGRWFDLLRPNAVPDGFASLEEARADRAFHLGRVRAMLEQVDVFVFTLGLTESWFNASRGHTYPVCPGTARGRYEPAEHQFRNLTQGEVLADLHAIVSLLSRLNPRLKLILTVSPVPLVATYTKQNVLVASSYSKAVLRAAAGEAEAAYGHVQYFPSFEIVSHAASFGQYLNSDLREVSERGVAHVMDCFFGAFYSGEAPQPRLAAAAPADPAAAVQALLDAECEEMFNELERPRAGP